MLSRAPAFHLLWLLPALLALAWAERQWPSVALWSFVLLTLTLGFAHGAMDVMLLRDAQGRVMFKHFAMYLGSVLVLAAALLSFPGIALLVLLFLSLWHFGEQAVLLHEDERHQLLLRMVQGGASVMLPVLLSGMDLKVWVAAIAPESTSWVWPLWVALAGLWLALLVAAIAVIQPWRAGALVGGLQVLMWELVALVLLNALLSPLLAFTLFFGLYHSGMHVWRMRSMQQREDQALPWLLLSITLLLTWTALAILWWQMPILAQPAQWGGDSLRWLVVALAAVTLPHMVLVSRTRDRLFHGV